MLTETAEPYKQLLIARRAVLLDQLASLRGGEIGRVAASAEHFGRSEDSLAETSAERELEFALDARESAELDEVQAALERIAAGRYGLCSDCGQAISTLRLRATPQASRCINCQEAAE